MKVLGWKGIWSLLPTATVKLYILCTENKNSHSHCNWRLNPEVWRKQYSIQYSIPVPYPPPPPPPPPPPQPLNVSRVEVVEPQVNQFGQVSSDVHQMSGAEGVGTQAPYPGEMKGATLPCDLSHDSFHVTYPPLLYGQRDTSRSKFVKVQVVFNKN